MYGCDGDRVVKDYCIEPFFYLFYVLFWDLHECLTKEYGTWIEFGMEAQALIRYKKPAMKYDLITQTTREAFVYLFI